MAVGLRTLCVLMGEKLEPTGTSALPGVTRHAKSCREMGVRWGWSGGGGLADVEPAGGGRS